MSDRIPLTEDQINQLKSVTENGGRNYHLGYRHLYDFIKDNPAVDDDTKFFIRRAAEINTNAFDSPSNYFIRSATGSGFLWDGLFVGDPDARLSKTQANSDAIGRSIFLDIFNRGTLPRTQDIIPHDATTAVEKGLQSIGGWGGAFYFWNIFLKEKEATVGQLILKDPAELEKFLSINSKALYDTSSEFGITGEQFIAGYNAQVPRTLQLEMLQRAASALITRGDDWRRRFAGDPDDIFGFKALVRDNGRLVSWYTTRPGGPGMPEAHDMVHDPKLEAALNRHRAVRLEKAEWTPWQSRWTP
ncbi:MAG TPA: hypothetical protein VJ890_25425 [Vineibacter sp.]|nr:hypothetical protein [Vineibacter sp.]